MARELQSAPTNDLHLVQRAAMEVAVVGCPVAMVAATAARVVAAAAE